MTADASVGSGSDRAAAARRIFQEYGLILVLVVLVAFIAIREPSFVEGQNLLNLLQQWAPLGLMAIAGTFVIISGGFDLSVGGTYAMGAVLAAGLAQHVPIPVAVAGAIAGGMAIGLANGLVVTKAHVNPFIATLGMGQVARGVALVVTGAVPIVIDKEPFFWLGSAQVGPVAVSSIILVVCFLVGGFILARTVYGRTMYAIGGNSEASRLSGLKVDRLLVTAYIVSGASAALAGVLVASRLGTGQADIGSGIEFDVIIAIVLGGTAISGGAGAMWRTAVGLALVAVMQNGFDSLQVNPFYQVVIKGAILVLAVAWDEYIRRQKLSGGRARTARRPPKPVAEA
jgi:ribose/xylose/arabinose/galactoside ABC-type transport system permease subunit